MPEPPLRVNYGAYYLRFFRQSLQDLFKLGSGQVIGALLTIGILAFQLYYGLIPRSLTMKAVASIGWPYLLVVGTLCVLSALRAPAQLDAECLTKISKLTDELAHPDQMLAEHLRGLLADISENAKKILRFALLYDIVERGQIKVKGLSLDEIWEAIEQCKSAGLLRVDVEYADTSSPLALIRQHVFCQIPPKFSETLKRLLYNGSDFTPK